MALVDAISGKPVDSADALKTKYGKISVVGTRNEGGMEYYTKPNDPTNYTRSGDPLIEYNGTLQRMIGVGPGDAGDKTAYWGVYDTQGNLTGLTQRKYGEQSWIGKLAPYLIAAGAGAILGPALAGGFGAEAGAASGGVYTTPVQASEFMGAATEAASAAGLPSTAASQIAATAADLVSAGKGAAEAITSAIKSVATSLGVPVSLVTAAVKAGVGAITGAVTGGTGGKGGTTGMLGGAIDLAGQTAVAGKTVDAVNALGDKQIAAGEQWGQGYIDAGIRNNQRMFDLGDTQFNQWDNVGKAQKAEYDVLGADVYGKRTALADKATAMQGEFKPYAITNNIGSSDTAGNYRLNTANQGVNDAAVGAARSSFDAANAFDLDNMRKQEFGLMRSLYDPYDQAAAASLEARMQAQGRLGLQSFNPANSVTDTQTGQVFGAAPELVAQSIGQRDRDLKSYIQADSNATQRRGALIDQGTKSMSVPFQYGVQGDTALRTGALIGQQDFDNKTKGATLYADLAGRGITDYGNIKGRGIDDLSRSWDKGVGAQTALQAEGIRGLGQTELRGLDRKFQAFNAGIETKFKGEMGALRFLSDMYAKLGGAVASLPNSVSEATKTIVDQMVAQGWTEDEAIAALDQAVNEATGDIGMFSGEVEQAYPWDDALSF